MDDILHATPGNPVPDNHIAGYFTAFDGCRLRYAIFRSKASVARGTIVLLQGRNETIEKYYETIAAFTDLGFWVATFDWRGQGGSDRLLKNPLKGYVRHFSHYERDLAQFLEEIVLPDTRLPFYLLAHSMGGLIALSAAPALANRVERMVLAAPFVELGGQRFGRTTIRIMTGIASMLGFGRMQVAKYPYPRPFEGNTLTSDRARFARNVGIVDAVPALRLSGPTARWTSQMIRAMARVERQEFLEQINVPTLILAAVKDRIVPLPALERLAARFRAGYLLQIDNARHELFQEVDIFREQALAATEAFFAESEMMPADAASGAEILGTQDEKAD